MGNKKIIKVLEPYGGWIDFNNKSAQSELDTGFVNRLIYWRSAYLISKIHNFEFELHVEDLMWPELNIIELPNTKSVCPLDNHIDYLEYKNDFLSWEFNENPKPIGNDLIRDVLLSKSKTLNDNHYFTQYPFNWDEYTKNNDLLKFPKIKFKYDFIERIIKNNIKKNYIGVHIRRGNGTMLPVLGSTYSDNNINAVTNNSDMNIVGWRKINKLNLNNTPYIPDSYYFNYMDSIISVNPNVKFFMSYDIPYRFVKKFEDRYGDKLITSDYFLDEIEYELSNIGFQFELSDYKNIINNLIDLFSLAQCSSVIMNPMSSWSLFLRQYKNMKPPILKSTI